MWLWIINIRKKISWGWLEGIADTWSGWISQLSTGTGSLSLSLFFFFFWHKIKGPSLYAHVLIDNNDLVSFIFFFSTHTPFLMYGPSRWASSFCISFLKYLSLSHVSNFWIRKIQPFDSSVIKESCWESEQETHIHTHGNPQHAHINCGNCFLLMCNQEAGRPFALKKKRRNLSAPTPTWPSWLIPTAHGQPVCPT